MSGKTLMSYQIGDAKITKITETILESFTRVLSFLALIQMCGRSIRSGSLRACSVSRKAAFS